MEVEQSIKTLYDLGDALRQKQDEFLDIYSLYQKAGIAWIRDELRLKAYELHLLDPNFRFRV